MNLSEKKISELYSAISEPIMVERIEIRRNGSPDGEVLDNKLFKLQNKIWRDIHKILNIKTPA